MGECLRLHEPSPRDAEGWRALFVDDLDELKAVNERQARHYTEAHTALS
ncbi:hypothetical protein ACPCTO_18095 [Streptomyces olivoreticuli]